MAVKRGEVWLADLSPMRGTEQSDVCPVPEERDTQYFARNS